MNLTELLDRLEWPALARELAARYRAQACAVDAKGRPLGPDAPACNPLCKAVRGHPEACESVCRQSLLDMAGDAFEEGRTVLSECEAGLGMIVVPVLVSGRVAGALAACGWLDPEGDVDVLLLEEETGIAEDELDALIPDIPEASPDELRELLALLKDTAAKAQAR